MQAPDEAAHRQGGQAGFLPDQHRPSEQRTGGGQQHSPAGHDFAAPATGQPPDDLMEREQLQRYHGRRPECLPAATAAVDPRIKAGDTGRDAFRPVVADKIPATARWIKIERTDLQHLLREPAPAKIDIGSAERLGHEPVANDGPEGQIERQPVSHLGKAGE